MARGGRGGTSPNKIDAGTVVAGRYEVVKRIARGVSGVVYEARDRESEGASVALKLLNAGRAVDEDSEERFRREAMVLFDLRHPAIVRVLDFGVLPEGGTYLAMERVEGETLAARLARKGALAATVVGPIANDLWRALDHAHKNGVIHRDIEPSNVILTEVSGPGEPHAKLLDFGLAKVTWDAPMTGSGVQMGSLAYMPPEQLRGARDVDARSDVYGLGVVLYEALAGHRVLPYEAETDIATAVMKGPRIPLSARNPSLPGALDDVLARAVTIDPADRWPSAADFGRAFAAALGG